MLSRASSSSSRTLQRSASTAFDYATCSSSTLPPLFLCPRLAQPRRLQTASCNIGRLRHHSTATTSSSSSNIASSAESSQAQHQAHLNEQAQPQAHTRYRFNTYAPPVPGAQTKPALSGSAATLAAKLEPLLRADAHAGPQAWKDAFAGGPAFGDESVGRTAQAAKEAEQSFDAAIAASSSPAELQVVLDLARDLVARPSARLASARTVEPGTKDVLVEAWELLSSALFGHREAFKTKAAAAATPLLSDADRKAGLICVVYLSRAAYASSLPAIARLRAASATSLGPPSLAALQKLVIDAGKAGDAKRVLRFVDGIVALHSGTTNAWLLYARARALSTRSAHSYDWDSLDDYWQCYALHRRSNGRPLQPPRYLFEFLLRHYIAQRDTSTALRVLRTMVDDGYTPSAESWLALLRVHPAWRPVVRAVSSADWAEGHAEVEATNLSAEAQKSTLDKLVSLRAHQRDARGALLVLRAFGVPTGGQVRRRGSVTPSASTYAPLVHLFFSLASPALALRFCSLTFKHRHSKEPTELLERALLSALSALRRAELAPEALALASAVLGIHNIPMAASHSPINLNAHLEPTDRLFGALIRCVAHLPTPERPDVARFVLRDLFARGMKPGKYVLRALGYLLFTSMANAMDWDRAKRTLYRVTPTALHKRTQRLATAIETAEAEKRSRLVLPAEKLIRLDTFVRMLDQHGFEDKLVLAGPRNSLLERSLVERMQPYLEAQPALSRQEEDELSASSEASSAQSSAKGTAVEREVDLSIALTPAAYAMRLRVYAVQRLDHASASALFRAMIRHGSTPDMQHIAPLVEGLVEAGQVRDAARVTTRAVASLGVEPTLRIHTALIRGYANQGDWESVDVQLNKLQSTGLSVDAALQEVLATARSRAREAIGAQASESDIALLDQPNQPLSTEGITARLSVLLKAAAVLPAQQLLVSHLSPEKPDIDAQLRRTILNMSDWVDRLLQTLRQEKGHDKTALASIERTQRRIEEVVRLNRTRLKLAANARVGARRKLVKLIFEAVVDEELKE